MARPFPVLYKKVLIQWGGERGVRPSIPELITVSSAGAEPLMGFRLVSACDPL